MKKYVIGICGSYGENGNTFDGQTIKTKNITHEMEEILGVDKVYYINTHYWKSNPLFMLLKCIRMVIMCDNIIILPAQRGLRVFVPLFTFLKKPFKFNLFYSVIGGWLPEYLKCNKILKNKCSQIDIIFVETNTMKKELERLGFNNISIAPNFKHLKILNSSELIYSFKEPYKLIIFSRVMNEKGISEAIGIVKRINEEYNRTIFVLDIYGLIITSYEKEFSNMQKEFPSYIKYKGIIDSKLTIDTMKNYFLHLFPTKFKTEGFPGSVLDALCAGVPTLASKWNSCEDILTDGYNGIIFDFMNYEDMYVKLKEIINNAKYVNKMKVNCLQSAENYRPINVTTRMLREMGIS